MKFAQARQDVAQSEENDGESQQSSKRSNSSDNESLDRYNPLIQLYKQLNQLKAEVMNIDFDAAPLNDQLPLPTTNITENLIKLMQETKVDDEFPESSFKKVMENLDKDIEDCSLLITSMSERIENETKLQQKLNEQRKVLKTLREDVNSESYVAPEDISVKVRQMFKKYKADLLEIVSVVGGEKTEEYFTILGNLTSAYLNDAGTQEQYVKVDDSWDKECIFFLVSNRIAIWNDYHTHLKLHM